MLAQSLSSAAYSISVAVNQLTIVDMTQSRELGGLPTAVILGGSALMAYIAGKAIPRFGRRNVLSMGAFLGGAGALLASLGVVLWSPLVFLCGLLILGFGRGVLDHSRYTASEVNPPDRRARALSFVVWGATIGGVGGPLIAPFVGNWAAARGLNQYAGPLLSTGILYLVACLAIFVLLSVDLKGLAARVAALSPKGSTPTATTNRSFREVMSTLPNARVALVAMVAGQSSMALMMACISIHMKDHQHTLTTISIVTSAHIFGMFAFSPLVGQLADKYGRRPVIIAGALTLITGCLLVPVSLNTPVIAFAEFLVGLGWSACFVAGSALLTDTLGAAERARLQGANDSFVNIGSAIGSLSSGPLLQLVGIWPLAFVGLLVATLPLIFALRVRPPAQPALATR